MTGERGLHEGSTRKPCSDLRESFPRKGRESLRSKKLNPERGGEGRGNNGLLEKSISRRKSQFRGESNEESARNLSWVVQLAQPTLLGLQPAPSAAQVLTKGGAPLAALGT